MSHQKKTSIAILINIMVFLALTLLDYLSGHRFSFFVFYFIPVYVAAYYAGLVAGVFFSFLSAIAWFIVETLNTDFFSSERVILWNTFSRLITFLLLTLTVIYIRQGIKQRDNLKRRSDELLAANRDLQSFAYSISHDLRNPVNIIIAFSEIINESRDTLSSEQKEALSRIISEGHRAKEIISDLLRLTSIGSQEISINRINLSDIARDSIESFSTIYDLSKYEISIEPQMIVSADPGLIRLVFDNLIGNAIKFSVKSDSPRIEIGREKQGNEMVFYVKDNGVGFDVEDPNRVFDPFVRVHSSRDYPGTGIGLSIVRKIIERHRGKIWVSSEINKGTVFYFTLFAK